MDEVQSLAAVQVHIQSLESELADAKRVANNMSTRAGRGPIYAEVEQPGVANLASIRSDQFYGKSLATAIREYLTIRRSANVGPATVTEIHAALLNGGFEFETKEPDNAKRNLRISLTKNTALFHRMPDGAHYGLVEWYPEAKRRDTENNGEIEFEERSVKKRKTTPSKGDDLGTLPKAPTLRLAVRRAIKRIDGEFTKQDLVDWIDKKYPQLKVAKRQQSVFTMFSRFKDELGVKTVRAEGRLPHVFCRNKTGGGEQRELEVVDDFGADNK
jgi:hypothetical protein